MTPEISLPKEAKKIYSYDCLLYTSENGMNILGAHIDSPRIDVKQNPLYENEELAYLDTCLLYTSRCV